MLVRSRLGGTNEAIKTEPGFDGSFGMFHHYSFTSLGYGGETITSEEKTNREIEITIFSASDLQTPMRSIAARSVGERNSVSAVAYEMCAAAFRDYPQNIKGKN